MAFGKKTDEPKAEKKSAAQSMPSGEFYSAISIARRLQKKRNGCSVERLRAKTGYEISEGDYSKILAQVNA